MGKEFDCNARIRIKEKDSEINNYFGRGVADLLHGIETWHSLNLCQTDGDGIQQGMADPAACGGSAGVPAIAPYG